MPCIQRTSQVVEFSLCCIKSWKGNEKTPAGGVKKGNIKRWRILKKNNNLIFAHGLMVGRLVAELSVFLFCGDDDGPGSVNPSPDAVILSPLCSSCWSFPLCTDRGATSHHSMMLHNRRQKSFKSSGFYFGLFHYGQFDLTRINNTDSRHVPALYCWRNNQTHFVSSHTKRSPFVDFVSCCWHDNNKVA